MLNQAKTLMVAIVLVTPENSRQPSASVHTPAGTRVPPLRSGDYCQPSLSIANSRSLHSHHSHHEPSVHSSAGGHRNRQDDRDCPRTPRPQQHINLRDFLNRRRADGDDRRRHHSPNHHDDDDEGVPAFTNDLRRVNWPAGFKPTGIEKYDGKTGPESWLTIYTLAICAVGGDSKAMANYLLVALPDLARNWLAGSPRGTIGSWDQLLDHFIANFQGTFERPRTHFELYNITQKPDETLSDYIHRFSEKCNTISDITEDNIIATFSRGIHNDQLIGKFGHKPPRIVKQMFEKENVYAKAEDAIRASKQSGSSWKNKKRQGQPWGEWKRFGSQRSQA